MAIRLRKKQNSKKEADKKNTFNQRMQNKQDAKDRKERIRGYEDTKRDAKSGE